MRVAVERMGKQILWLLGRRSAVGHGVGMPGHALTHRALSRRHSRFRRLVGGTGRLTCGWRLGLR